MVAIQSERLSRLNWFSKAKIEPVSFEKMDQFSAAHGLQRSENYHREIYLSNANRVEKSKLKTILRYSVEQIPVGSV